MEKQESMSYYARHRCYTTEVREYLYQKLRDAGILHGNSMNPKVYVIYSKIRAQVSKHVGKSTKYGIFEYDAAREFLDNLFESGEYIKYVERKRK